MSDLINLNSEEFDSSDVVIFNNGTAGVVENVKITVKKGEADKPANYPDYHVGFVSSNGGSVDKGFYHLDSNSEDFTKRLVGLGKELKHLWGVLIGEEPIPEYKTAKEMLDGMMLKFKESVDKNPDRLFRTMVAYGTQDYPQKYLRIPFFPPYVESMEVPIAETRIRLPRNARMTPFVEDERITDYEVHTDTDSSSTESDGWV